MDVLQKCIGYYLDSVRVGFPDPKWTNTKWGQGIYKEGEDDGFNTLGK